MSCLNYNLITLAFTIKFLSESQGNLLKPKLRKLSLIKRKTRILRQKKPPIPGSEVVCKSSSRPSLVKPSPSKSSQLTPLKMSKLRSKTNQALPHIDKDSSTIKKYFQTGGLFLTTTSNTTPLSIRLAELDEVFNLTINCILILIFNNSLFLLIQSVV